MSVKVRFAPSPTGLLHVGNIRAALLNWLFARQQGGHFLLRIDDTDVERSREDYVEAIKRDLLWLGLDSDSMARQSERLDRYDAAILRLKAMGRLYPCYETPEELAFKRRVQLGRGLPPVYDRAALRLTDAEKAGFEADGRKPHWRFLLDRERRVEWHDLIRGDQAIDPASLSDPVLVRADGSYLYMLPSTVDDIDFQISHVIRGEDHVTNSAEQIQIFAALGATVPHFAHYPLLSAKDGGKFSKRGGGGSIGDLRDMEGIEPMAVVSFLARLGSSDPIEAFATMTPLIESFDFGKFSRAAARFDLDELRQLNARILHGLDYAAVRDRPELMGEAEDFWLAIRGNIDRLSDCRDWHAVLRAPLMPSVEDADRAMLKTAADLLPDDLSPESWKPWTAAVAAATGRKGKALFLPLRRALTARDHGPEMAALLPLLGRDRILKRLEGVEG